MRKLALPIASLLLAGAACKSGGRGDAGTVSPGTASEEFETFQAAAVEVTHNQLLYVQPSLQAPALSRYLSEEASRELETGRIMVLTALGRQGEWLKVVATGCELGGPRNARFELWVPLKSAQVVPGVEPPTCKAEPPREDAAGDARVPSGPVFSREGTELGRLVVDWAGPAASGGPGDGDRSCHATTLGLVDPRGWRALELCVDPAP